MMYACDKLCKCNLCSIIKNLTNDVKLLKKINNTLNEKINNLTNDVKLLQNNSDIFKEQNEKINILLANNNSFELLFTEQLNKIEKSILPIKKHYNSLSKKESSNSYDLDVFNKQINDKMQLLNTSFSVLEKNSLKNEKHISDLYEKILLINKNLITTEKEISNKLEEEISNNNKNYEKINNNININNNNIKKLEIEITTAFERINAQTILNESKFNKEFSKFNEILLNFENNIYENISNLKIRLENDEKLMNIKLVEINNLIEELNNKINNIDNIKNKKETNETNETKNNGKNKIYH